MSTKRICGIYKITSPTGKIYIGQSVNIKVRWKDHKKRKYIRETKLYKSFQKYGVDSHLFDILDECEEMLLNEKEKYYIILYDTFNTENGLNHTKGGGQNNEGIRNAMRGKPAWNRGISPSEETKQKIREARKRQPPMSKEGRERVSIANKGRVSPMKGKKHTAEAKAKISLKSSTRIRGKYSDKSRALMSEKSKINSRKMWDRIKQEKLTMIF